MFPYKKQEKQTETLTVPAKRTKLNLGEFGKFKLKNKINTIKSKKEMKTDSCVNIFPFLFKV